MSVLVTVGGTAVSLGALGYLAATDPKRRRAFRLPPVGARRSGLGWLLALAPGVLVPVWSGGGGFVVWLGAVSVAGWALVAVSPARAADGRRHLAAAGAALAARVGPAVRGVGDAVRRTFASLTEVRRVPSGGRMADLERRVAELEAEVAALRRQAAGAAPAGVVVELPVTFGRSAAT